MVCLKCDHRRPKAANASDSFLQSQIEDLDCQNNRSKSIFSTNQGNINDQTSVVPERENRNRSSGMWRFVDDSNENHQCSYSWNDTSQYNDFPIAGGKSDLSKSSQNIQAWKKDMLNRNKSSLETTESEDEFWSDDNQSNFTDDDEEMAEWFGKGKGD